MIGAILLVKQNHIKKKSKKANPIADLLENKIEIDHKYCGSFPYKLAPENYMIHWLSPYHESLMQFGGKVLLLTRTNRKKMWIFENVF